MTSVEVVEIQYVLHSDFYLNKNKNKKKQVARMDPLITVAVHIKN